MKTKMIGTAAVPAIGFGTWTLKGAQCIKAVKDALETGYRHIDTAQIYANEIETGKGIKAAAIPRNEIFLTTKVSFRNLAFEDVITTTEESLQNLQTDYIDLLLIHWSSKTIPLEETLDAMQQLQQQGKIKHIGVSNFSLALLKKALSITKIFCNQVEYHPFLSQQRLLDFAVENNIMITAYCPLAKGHVVNNEILSEIGKKYNKSNVQVALRWLTQQQKVVAIPRSSSHHHRINNYNIFDFELEPHHMQQIFEMSNANLRLVDPEWAPDWNE